MALVHRRRDDRGVRRRGLRRAQRARSTRSRRSRRGEPLLLRILPDGPGDARARGGGRRATRSPPRTARSRSRTRACREARSRCSSSRCCPRRGCMVAGDSPIAAALRRLGAELGLDMVRRSGSRAAAPGGGGPRAAWSPPTAAMSCEILRAGARGRACPTSGWWPAASAVRPCSRSSAGEGVAEDLLEHDRDPGRARHRRPHAGGDRALDPGPDRRGAPRRELDAARCAAARAAAARPPRSTRSAG